MTIPRYINGSPGRVMGCGSGRIALETDVLKEPPLYPIDIDFVLDEYPSPVPSRKKKSSIYNETDFEKVDYQARIFPEDIGNDIHDFTKHLTQGLQNNLEKIRIIFVWLGLHSNNTQDIFKESPKEIRKLFQENKASFAYIFTRLCRAAEVPCVIIPGLAKSLSYQVGDDVDKVQALTNYWNAVYVEQEWRLVFPLWAYRSAFIKDDEGEEHYQGKEEFRLNEYFFLTDPEDFIYVAMATDPAWQLIKDPYTIEKFCTVPHLRQPYFASKVRIVSDFTSRIYSCQGLNKISLKSEVNGWIGQLNCELQFILSESAQSPPFGIDLNRYVIMERRDAKWSFHIRYPCVGIYIMTINVRKTTTKRRLCHFKLYAREINENINPLPYIPGITGWGVSVELEKGGLTAPSQRHGFVFVKVMKEINFRFKIIKDIKTRCVLVNNKITSRELQRFVTKEIKDDQLDVNVCIPTEGEYGLLIFCRNLYTNRETNACNYLLSSDVMGSNYQKKKKQREDATERTIRTKLQHLTRSYELDELSQAIQKFQKYQMEDHGDLSKALDRQEYLELKKELKVAVNRRHLGTLIISIKPAKSSKYEEELRNLILEAETVRDHLVNLNKFAHEIMELCQRTVSEVHSYKNPKPPIHDVMMATCLLLGEPGHHLEDWCNIQRLLEVVGPQSLLVRIRSFDSVNVNMDTLENVRAILQRYDKDTVHLASPAAATFFIWASNVANEIQQHADELQRQKKKRNILDNLNQRRRTFIVD